MTEAKPTRKVRKSDVAAARVAVAAAEKDGVQVEDWVKRLAETKVPRYTVSGHKMGRSSIGGRFVSRTSTSGSALSSFKTSTGKSKASNPKAISKDDVRG